MIWQVHALSDTISKSAHLPHLPGSGIFFLAKAQQCSSVKSPEIPGQLRSTIDKSEHQRVQKQIAHVELGMFPHPVTRIDLYLPMVKLSLGEVTSQFWCSLAFAHCKLLLSHGWRRGGMGKDNMLRGRVIMANQVQVLNSPPSSFSASAILKLCNYIKKST